MSVIVEGNAQKIPIIEHTCVVVVYVGYHAQIGLCYSSTIAAQYLHFIKNILVTTRKKEPVYL